MRDRNVILFVGARKHGKTRSVSKLVMQTPDANALIYKEGVNLYDRETIQFPLCNLEDGYRGGKVRIDGGQVEYGDFMRIVISHFRNGMLVIDDASLFEVDNISKELRKVVVNCRRMGVDVVLVYHSISDVPIRLLTFVNTIVLHHTTDEPSYKQNKVPGMEGFKIAQARIANKVAGGNKYYHEVFRLA